MLGGSVPRVEKERTGSIVNTWNGVSISRAIRYSIMRPAYHPRLHCSGGLTLRIVWDVRNSVELVPTNQPLVNESLQQNAYQLIASVACVLANNAAPIGLRDRLSASRLELTHQGHFLGTPQLGSHCIANVAEQGSRFTDCYRGV